MLTQKEIKQALIIADEDYAKFQEYGRQIGVNRSFIDPHVEHTLAAALRAEKARADLMEKQYTELRDEAFNTWGFANDGIIARHITERAALDKQGGMD